MLDFLGRWTYRARWPVLAGAVLFLGLAGVWGSTAFDHLTGSGFTYAGSESARADELGRTLPGQADADLVVVFRSETWRVDDPRYARAATAVLDGLPAELVAARTDYWTTRQPALVAADRRTSFATVQVAGADERTRTEHYEELADRFVSPDDTVRVTVGGPLAMFAEVNERSEQDLARAERLALPVVFLLLVLLLRNLVAAALPVVVGVLAIVGSLAGLRLLTSVVDVSVFAVNIVTLLGLGLAVDYSLFVVSRFREELDRAPVPAALRATMRTAGRTILVSAVTVAVAMSSLFVFPQTFLRSIGLGAIMAVLLAVAFSLTVMPALLAVLGHRVRPWRAGAARHTGPGPGVWGRTAYAVMRRPVLVGAAVVGLLLLLALPFLRVSYGWLDARVLPQSTESRQAQDTLDANFPANLTSPVQAVVTLADPVGSVRGQRDLTGWLLRVESVPGVTGTDVTGGAGSTATVSVRFAGQPISDDGRRLVRAVRAVEPPPGGQVLVGGNSATFTDLLAVLGDRLPWMALVMLLATFVLLFLAFGSVVLPIKAILLNVLNLAAAFGVVVWIFQDGRLTGLLDFTPTGDIDVIQLILILAVAFALSMDYEVFLLSRIREQYDLTGDNREAVATGLERSGRIITGAALLLVIVIGAFATSEVLVVKIVGIGLAVAIVLDATIIRMLLVPASMRLLGTYNWWMPAPLRPLYSRWGIREEGRSPEREPEEVAT
ncbi:MAG: Transmembrane transport protein MmpL3 [uncultured Corynebacteriales bacterium]|uniref:Transmembrane transport protein MmpL3 n=1 Tax=uncultured Mycobacteriales bacterium TaxID=581187 RepID=A0A6J4JZS8_9ACTN|nr:MAG: Transmembrane transport protein MmpL3 [uncultured Corynebacteriales bacterium]